jgi:hypothetical protein
VRNLLLKKRHVVNGVRDAFLEREELVGDEIEALMAELGERDPIEVPALAPAGSGEARPVGAAAPAPGAHGNEGGNGRGSTPPPAPSVP